MSEEKIEQLEKKVKELEDKIEHMTQGMSIFNHNFQGLGNALVDFHKRLDTVEAQASEELPHDETVH